ncbi:MAG: urease accessory protein UreD [Candidatus Acidiferrales bacterium]
MASVAENPRAIGNETCAPPRLQASLSLEFARDEHAGRTVLAASRQQPPLKVVRAFAVQDGAALAHLHNVSGGLLGGDRLALHVTMGAGARVQLTTTGATRIYRPREGAPPATQTNEFTVREGALLEYVPDAIIPFAGARFSQASTIHLAQGAGLFWWEILAPGREARGEVFAYDCVEMKTGVFALGRPIVGERVRIEPQRRAVSSLGRLGPYRTWATFCIARVGLGAADWLAIERELREQAAGLASPGETLWGISALPAHGLMVRCVAVHGRHVLPGLQALWQTAKRRLYGCDAVLPRKVN